MQAGLETNLQGAWDLHVIVRRAHCVQRDSRERKRTGRGQTLPNATWPREKRRLIRDWPDFGRGAQLLLY